MKTVSGKSKINVHPWREIKPKSQTAAILQLCRLWTHSQSASKVQDERMLRLLDSYRRRDEMFLAFQKEQAEGNTRHELMML